MAEAGLVSAARQPAHLRRASAGPLRLYLDASALVKAFIDEDGSNEVTVAIAASTRLTTARHAFVETGRAILREADSEALIDRFRRLWATFVVIEIDARMSERALDFAAEHRLRTLDALPLAAAAPLARGSTFATWDRDLWDAARAEGFEMLPADRP